jgi:hypothetical protein
LAHLRVVDDEHHKQRNRGAEEDQQPHIAIPIPAAGSVVQIVANRFADEYVRLKFKKSKTTNKLGTEEERMQ